MTKLLVKYEVPCGRTRCGKCPYQGYAVCKLTFDSPHGFFMLDGTGRPGTNHRHSACLAAEQAARAKR